MMNAHYKNVTFALCLLITSCLPKKKVMLSSEQSVADFSKCDQVDWLISKIKSGATLPSNLKKCPTVKLADSLVRNLSKNGEGLHEGDFRPSSRRTLDSSKHGETFNADAYQVEIRFNPFIMGKVIENGVLNQHQLGVSLSASVNPEGRAQLEDHLIGIKLEDTYESGMKNRLNEVRPKYGYLNTAIESRLDPRAKRQRLVYFRNTELDAYGCVALRFKKDINRRSTWTFGDSLAQFEEIIALNSQSVKPFWFDPPRTLLSRSIKMPTVMSGRDVKYLEAQVWGPLTMQDVESIVISKSCGLDGSDSAAESQVSLLALLKKTNLPIYRTLEGVVDAGDRSISPRMISLGNKIPPDNGYLYYAEKVN
ncbi:MAG: hypothetical protein RL189_2667 [Pseudomonadota bacterium]|jgi:hypothetical protein